MSAVISCRNGEPFVARALTSILSQNYPDLEVVFWDNQSTDRSAAIAASFGDRVRVFKSPSAMTLGRARNAAVSEATGELIALLDVDDYWLPGKIEKQVALLTANPNLGLVFTDMQRVLANDRVVSRWSAERPFFRGAVFAQLLRGCFISISTVVMRRGVFVDAGAFDPRFGQVEDWDLWLRISQRCDVDFVPEVLVHEQLHEKQESRKFDDVAAEVEVLLGEIAERHPELSHVCREQMAVTQVKRFVISGYQALRARELGRALRSATRCAALVGTRPIEVARGIRPWLTGANRRMFLARYS